MLARSYYGLGNRPKARETLHLLSQPPFGADAVFLGGKIETETGDVETTERKYALASLYYKAQRYPECRQVLLDLIRGTDYWRYLQSAGMV